MPHLELRKFRTVTAAPAPPIPDDPDPNVTPPAATDELLLAAHTPCGYRETCGFMAKLVITGGSTNTADVRVYVKNETTGDTVPWGDAQSLLAVASGEMITHDRVKGSRVYFRLTNIDPAATSVECWAVEC